jgi:hypothetical protein
MQNHYPNVNYTEPSADMPYMVPVEREERRPLLAFLWGKQHVKSKKIPPVGRRPRPREPMPSPDEISGAQEEQQGGKAKGIDAENPDNPDNPDTTNAYETLVYPKAKDKTVDYVITHYDKVFKRAPSHMQKMFTVPLKKVRVPYSFK